MKRFFQLLFIASVLLACNKVDKHPELYGTWGTSSSYSDGHTLVINDDNTGHPYESPCYGLGDLKVKLKDDILQFKKNGSVKKDYIVTAYPTVADQMITFYAQRGCLPYVDIIDTIFTGETYMILNDDIYLKKRN